MYTPLYFELGFELDFVCPSIVQYLRHMSFFQLLMVLLSNERIIVVESITSLHSDPSSMRHVESRVNQQGPRCKAKYSWMTDREVVL